MPLLRYPWAFVLALLAASLLHAAPPPPTSVEQWDVFELALDGPKDGNPFLDVSFSARFRQGERTITAAGFYDGDGIYRVRFMPDAPGDWQFETNSDRPTLAGRTGKFSVTPPSAKNHGPVRVAHTFHFAYADGTPYRELGTTCYAWTHQTDELEELTLKTLAASPFNKVRMCVFPTGRSPRQAKLRFAPFEGQLPRDWDKTRFNPEFFRHLEKRVAQLRDIGVEADVILFHPYDNTWKFNSMDAASDDRYVRYVVARLAAYRNVWWSLSNEYDYNRDKQETDWDRLGQLVQASDPHAHLRSIHNGTLIYNHTQSWVTHASIQNGAAVLDNERALLYRDVYRKPIVYDEVKYEGKNAARWGQLRPEELVLRFWNGTIAGTYVGHSETWRGTHGAWLSLGGELKGESVARLEFLRKILADSPPEGIEPIDKWQERRMGGKPGEYYLVYLGEQTPTAWPFLLYKSGLEDGLKFSAEVIDTWAMTITPVDGLFEIKKHDNYVFTDKDGRSVPLPGKPYQAIRLRRVGPPAANPVSTAEPNP